MNIFHVSPDKAVSIRGPWPAHVTNIALQLLPPLLHLVGVVEVIVQNILRQKLFIAGVAGIFKVVFVLFDSKGSHLLQRSVYIFLVSLQIQFVFEICLTEVTGSAAHSAVKDEPVEDNRRLGGEDLLATITGELEAL